MDEAFFTATAAWLTEAGIAGISEGDIISGFCRRCVETGMPLGRCIMFIDTLPAGQPVTDMYLGLHVGEVFYGNIGSHERLDFTVIGPAVNEASRIAAMCRSADQPLLVSTAFAEVGDIKSRLVSVGRFALRGVSHSQELFTLDFDA
jgi:class 3 adenylate cyclase